MNHRGPPVAEKDEDHRDDQQDCQAHRENHVVDRRAHRLRGVECHLVVHSRREILRKPLQFRKCLLVNLQRIRRRELRNSKSGRLLPVVEQVRGVTFRPQFRAPHIAQAHQSSVGVCLQNDVVELRRLAQTSDGPHADLIILPGNGRLLSNFSRSDLHVLL